MDFNLIFILLSPTTAEGKRKIFKRGFRFVCLKCSVLFYLFISLSLFFFHLFFYKSIYWKMMRLKDKGKVKNMQGMSGFKNFRQNI
jgi:hypothetical protein